MVTIPPTADPGPGAAPWLRAGRVGEREGHRGEVAGSLCAYPLGNLW